MVDAQTVTEARQEREEMQAAKRIADLERNLVWAMLEMDDRRKLRFMAHVLKVGGTGDLSDCETFIAEEKRLTAASERK